MAIRISKISAREDTDPELQEAINDSEFEGEERVAKSIKGHLNKLKVDARVTSGKR